MTMGLEIAAVCFDLDGTLVDSEGEAADSLELALRPLRRPLTAKERDFVVGHGFGEIYTFIKAGGGPQERRLCFADQFFHGHTPALKPFGARYRQPEMGAVALSRSRPAFAHGAIPPHR